MSCGCLYGSNLIKDRSLDLVAYLTKEICFRNRLRKMIVMKRVVGEGIKVRSPNSTKLLKLMHALNGDKKIGFHGQLQCY